MQIARVMLLVIGLCFVAGSRLRAEERPGSIDFERDIQPIFQKHCTVCHGGVRREGGLSLLEAKGIASTDSGIPVLVPGKPAESELIRRVTTSDAEQRMPASGPPLAIGEIEKLQRWIN